MAAGGASREGVVEVVPEASAPASAPSSAPASAPSLAERVTEASDVRPGSGPSTNVIITVWHGDTQVKTTAPLAGLESGNNPQGLATIQLVIKEDRILPIVIGKIDKLIFSSGEQRNTFIKKLSSALEH